MTVKIACDVRVHAWLVDRRYLQWHCHDRRCVEVQLAKRTGEKAIHVWDLETDETWTTYIPAETGQEAHPS